MNTEIVTIDLGSSESFAMLERAGDIIKNGGLVAFPTETVYGLGGDALNPNASTKIYAAKGRPSDNPLIVHIADINDLDTIAADVPKAALKLAEHYWPGPLTMIFRKQPIVPNETTGGLDTVAVRFPSHPVAAAFIKASGGFIAAPSANLSGRPSTTTAAHVIEDLSGRIDMIIDGGPCDIGLESTIVDFTAARPMILRPGFVSERMLEDVLGEVDKDPAVFGELLNDNIKPKAPGMKYRHYAPKGTLTIVSGDVDRVSEYIQRELIKSHNAGLRTGVITCSDKACSYTYADYIGNIGDRDDEAAIAYGLYSLLRECDEQSIDVIFSEEFNTPNLGSAIMNRLIKAAGHTIIDL